MQVLNYVAKQLYVVTAAKSSQSLLSFDSTCLEWYIPVNKYCQQVY